MICPLALTSRIHAQAANEVTMLPSHVCTPIETAMNWYESQSASNTFTLLGAIATAAATIVALYLSQQQTRRFERERRDRAVLCAMMLMPSIVRTVERARMLVGNLEFGPDAQRAHAQYFNALTAVMADLGRPVGGLNVETALALLPLGSGLGERLASGFASFELAQSLRGTLHPYAANNALVSPQQPPEAVVRITELLRDAERSFNEAVEASRRAIDRD